MEWQPIKTHEGGKEYVLLYGGGDMGVTVGYLWRGTTWVDVIDGNRDVDASHWMPLPTPPAT